MPSVYLEHPFDCSSFRDLCNLFFVDRPGRKVIDKRATMATKKTSYTVAEAAKAKGISRQAVHLAIKKGVLKAREKKVIRSEWLISSADLEAYQPSDRHQASGKKNN